MDATDPQAQRAAHRDLVERVRRGPGTTTPDQRTAAFDNVVVDPALRPLIGKVATAPTRITDADFDLARAAGLSDDQIFELVVAAAVGQSTRMYESALAALDEAAG
jgi:alkylhydroperoxidase family enzyme